MAGEAAFVCACPGASDECSLAVGLLQCSNRIPWLPSPSLARFHAKATCMALYVSNIYVDEQPSSRALLLYRLQFAYVRPLLCSGRALLTAWTMKFITAHFPSGPRCSGHCHRPYWSCQLWFKRSITAARQCASVAFSQKSDALGHL